MMDAGNTELGRNRKCITLTRDTDQKTISRAQGFYIEFAACILDTGGRERKYFELTVMSGSHGADSSVMKIGEDGDRKCGTLCRVSSGTELIKQNEGIRSAFSREETIFVIWEEKVLKDCSILCSSPTSAYTS